MKKQELLKIIDNVLLEKLFGFCYARTSDSYEAEELCSDIIFALVKTAGKEGDIDSPYPFIWRIAHNVYADFCDKRRRYDDMFYQGNSSDRLSLIAQEESDDGQDELLDAVCREISFLTKAYREVMILYYIDGLSTAEIARLQGISETAVRQRLFSARKKVKNEVEEMAENNNKPISLDTIEFVIWGTGNPDWGDPRNVCRRQFSKHIVWLCRKKPMSATGIAEKLNVPTVYVEEELEILTKGENGDYGLLRRLDNGKYAINFILFDRDEIEKATGIYTEQMADRCKVICEFVEKHREEYLAYPYLNRKVDINLILWQQVSVMSKAFSDNVKRILSQKYFAEAGKVNRPFSVYGYLDGGKYYGGGWDSIIPENICGYSKVCLNNIYITRIKQHFACGHNASNDRQLQLAIRAIDGLEIGTLAEDEKENAARAIECGYLYREGDMLYTKILVSEMKDMDRLFEISSRLSQGVFEEQAQTAAEKLARLIRNAVPEYLLAEWEYANTLASSPVIDALVEALIEKGLLIPPEGGIGAEGCWMIVEK